MTGHIITLRSIRIFVFILIAVSCSKGVDHQLDELEKQISSDPNSAYEELASISQHRTQNHAERDMPFSCRWQWINPILMLLTTLSSK